MELVNILNTIRDNASAEYQERIPEATRDNLDTIGALMISEDNIQIANEFVSTILNKLVKTQLHTKMFENPLKSLKRGTKPLGDSVEEVYNNFLKGQKFDGDLSQKLFQQMLPDTKTVYHRKNYDMQYGVTVTRQKLKRAFASYDALESYITNLVNTLYNSAEQDEFLNMKNILKLAFDNQAMKVVTIADPLTSDANAKKFIKEVKTVSGMMAFPSTQWNGYNTAQSVDTDPITTFSRKNEQILILDTATDIGVSVDVLASTFNMSVADFNDTRKIVIDQFPKVDGYDIKGCLVDEAFFQVYDDMVAFTEWFNPKGLYRNYYLTIEQTQAYSILVNAVAFAVKTA